MPDGTGHRAGVTIVTGIGDTGIPVTGILFRITLH